MITCPWCGTNYVAFQSNCQNCGGPLPAQVQSPSSSEQVDLPEDFLLRPPSPPRQISNGYVWRLLMSDGLAVVALVFGLLGVIFTLVGVGLTLGIVTAFVGIPFSLLGLLFLAAGAAIGAWRYLEAQRGVEVLRVGEAAEGQIVRVEQNQSVRINGRSPWVIGYRFNLDGRTYEGQVSTLNEPGSALQVGKRSYVLVLPQSPERNSLYPHP